MSKKVGLIQLLAQRYQQAAVLHNRFVQCNKFAQATGTCLISGHKVKLGVIG
jgi:hypothetical protein